MCGNELRDPSVKRKILRDRAQEAVALIVSGSSSSQITESFNLRDNSSVVVSWAFPFEATEQSHTIQHDPHNAELVNSALDAAGISHMEATSTFFAGGPDPRRDLTHHLYVPTHTIHGGVRAVGDESERISIDRDDIARIVSNVWASQKSEKWELRHLVRAGDGSKNRLQAEAAAYAALLLGRRRLGLRILRTALHAPSDDDRPFLMASSDRMTTIRSLLEARRAKVSVAKMAHRIARSPRNPRARVPASDHHLTNEQRVRHR